MAATLGESPTPGDLLNIPLVQIYSEPHNWDIWFEAAQLAYTTRPALVVDTLAVALEIALEGRGIALVNGPFATDDLAAGRLVRPVPHEVTCPAAGASSAVAKRSKTSAPARSWIGSSSARAQLERNQRPQGESRNDPRRRQGLIDVIPSPRVNLPAQSRVRLRKASQLASAVQPPSTGRRYAIHETTRPDRPEMRWPQPRPGTRVAGERHAVDDVAVGIRAAALIDGVHLGLDPAGADWR